MKIETYAALYKVDSFHSNKTNKDYHTLSLIIEGQAGTFFVSDKTYNEVIKSPIYNVLQKSAIPQVCTAVLDIRLSDKGAQVNVDSIKADGK